MRFTDKYEDTIAWCALLVLALVANWASSFLGDSLIMLILSGFIGLIGACIFMAIVVAIEILIDSFKK